MSFTKADDTPDFCCATLLRNKVVRSATMPNAATTKRATNGASCDTDDDYLISATLLVGAIANAYKRKKTRTYKRSIWTREWIEQRTIETRCLLTTAYFANSGTFNSVHSMSINKAMKQRIILKSQKAVTSNGSFYLHITQTIQWRKQPNVNKNWPISVRHLHNKLWRNRAGPYSDFCCAVCCKTLELGMTHTQLLFLNKVAQQKSRVISLTRPVSVSRHT